MGLHVGGFIVWRGVLVAREPASRSVDKTSLSASRNADRLRNGLLRSVGARCLRVACPGPAAAHGCRSLVQVLWLAYGSARQAARSSETAIAFAGAGRASTETDIAFAGAKWAFLVQFSGAEVMPVSRLPCWRRAVVLSVSMSPCCCASCAKKFALRGLMWVCARNSSPCALKTAKIRHFCACWESFFAEMQLEGLCWANSFACAAREEARLGLVVSCYALSAADSSRVTSPCTLGG